MSFVNAFKSAASRRAAMAVVAKPAATGGATRSVKTVPRSGTMEEMESDFVAQLRARIAYQKEIAAANPHKSVEEEWVELWTWIKISIFVAAPLCVLSILKDAALEEHTHRHEEGMPEYMTIRKKEFPWECDQCDLIDLACWRKCREEKKAGN